MALYQSTQKSLTQDDRDMLMVSMYILAKGAGITPERIVEIAMEVMREAENVRSSETN